MNNQSVTTKMVNLIRPGDAMSHHTDGEILHAGLLALNEHNRSRATSDNIGQPGHHWVVEDGMVGRWHELTWYASAWAVGRRG